MTCRHKGSKAPTMVLSFPNGHPHWEPTGGQTTFGTNCDCCPTEHSRTVLVTVEGEERESCIDCGSTLTGAPR